MPRPAPSDHHRDNNTNRRPPNSYPPRQKNQPPQRYHPHNNSQNNHNNANQQQQQQQQRHHNNSQGHPQPPFHHHPHPNQQQQQHRGGGQPRLRQGPQLKRRGSATKRGNRNSFSSHNNNNIPFHSGAPPSLEMTLRDRGCYDDNNEPRRRAALETLERILYQWSMDVMMRDSNNNNNNNKKGDTSNNTAAPTNPWNVPRVALVCFGSYRLGVHKQSSDIDVLALSPPHCTRADFFVPLVDRLGHDSRVTELHPIPSAYTPVIKFVLQGVQIDLLFARLQNATKLFRYQQSQPSMLLRNNSQTMNDPMMDASNNNNNNNRKLDEPPVTSRVEYLIDDSDLVGLDEAGVRSINGSRVSQFMLSLVPNVETFRLVLRAVKGWSDIHGVQSNVLGFLGGINWAILVARVAIDNPQADPPRLLLIFFQTYSQWQWPKPVTLGPICTEPPPEVMPMAAWNPKVNPRDGLHLMPIITPVFPSMNSAYNIGIPQLRRIQDEMCRAAYTLEHPVSGHPGDCRGIFQDGGFFNRHHNYLQIKIHARNAEDFLHWFRLCESRMRLLIASLETPEVQAWPFAKFFDRRYGNNHESFFFIAIRFAPAVETVDLRYLTSEFLHKINSWEGRKEGMDLSIDRVAHRNLPPFVTGATKANANANHPRNNNSNHNSNNNNSNRNNTNNRPSAVDVAMLCPQLGANSQIGVPGGGGMGQSPPKRARTVL